jgi:hypothetical protein
MDNSTRRQLLDKARSTGYPGSILEAFTAYDQGRDLIGEFVQQQQMQPPMQVAQTPEEQGQGLRPYHEQGQTNQSMAFPDVQPGQSFSTVGMKVPINIDKVDATGNLVESFKAVPPGIANLPTGPYKGTVIESPARMQTGGAAQDATAVKINPPVRAINLTNYQEANPTAPSGSEFDYQGYYDRANKYLSRPIFKGTTLTATDIADAAKDFYGATNYEYPLDLLLTQGQMETKLGKTLKSQHNYFNVGNTDSGATKDFPSPKDSVRNYMDLMYNDYLAKGQKSPEDLLKANAFVNTAGKRYASNPNYETELDTQRKYINSYISKLQMGGSYQTNQEISMYEWKSGLPENSRKRYIIGGLKNRVLYNKAKYKR